MSEERFALPIFVERQTFVAAGFGMWLIATIIYLSTNHFHWVQPVQLPFGRIDEITPFIPSTVWIYCSEYFLFGACYLTCRNLVLANKYIYAFLALQFVSNIIFFLWPTVYPRDLFPIPSDTNALTAWFFNGLRTTDSPANCCPSLHVSSCYLSSLIYWRENRKKFVFFFLWATAVGVSTLTTKQHYLIDVVTGLGMALLTYVIFFRWVRYRLPARTFPATGDQANL